MESDCSMLCSSPISAKIFRYTVSLVPVAAGIKRPLCAISCSKPQSLSVTVLPPVLGPVITSPLYSPPSRMETGTTFCASISGCLPSRISVIPSSVTCGCTAFMALASAALAKTTSSAVRFSMVYFQIVRMGTQFVAHLHEDALDLSLFLGLQQAQAVVCLHHGHRLDENRLAAARLVMDEAFDRAFVLLLDRHDIAPLPQRDDGVLQVFGACGIFNKRV